jgi:hypothetical protein
VDVSTRVRADADTQKVHVITYGRGTGGNQTDQWAEETGHATFSTDQFEGIADYANTLSEYQCRISYAMQFVYPILRAKAAPILLVKFKERWGTHNFNVRDIKFDDGMRRTFEQVREDFTRFGYRTAVCNEIEKAIGKTTLKRKLCGFVLFLVVEYILNQIDLISSTSFLIGD